MLWVIFGSSPLYDLFYAGQRGNSLGYSYWALRKAVTEAGPNATQPVCADLRARLDAAGRDALFASDRVKFVLSRGNENTCWPELAVCAFAKSRRDERAAVRHALNTLQSGGDVGLKGVLDTDTEVRFSLPLGQACPAVCSGLPLTGSTDCP